jgi:hypothetical protein
LKRKELITETAKELYESPEGITKTDDVI